MEIFSKRFLCIIQFSSQKDQFFSSREISQFLNTSTKTVLRTLKLYGDKDQCLEYGFFIYSKQGYGYKLVICDKNIFSAFKHQFFDENLIQNNDKSIRVYRIIQRLLNHSDYLLINDLAEELYVSESTVSSDLKEVRKELQKKGLHLEGKPSKGIKIEGSELSIRLCMAENFFTKSMDFGNIYTTKNVTEMERMISVLLEKWNVQLSDISREHLVAHILISIVRMENDHYITFDEAEKEQIQKHNEYKMAKELVENLSQTFSIQDQEEEISYIAIQLLGKRSLEENEREDSTDNINEILSEIFLEIENRLSVDLTSDEVVFQYLSSHFEPMLARLKYGITSNNPLMEDVKIKHQTSFEMGLIAKEVIYNKYKYILDDDEVSYLAMYFSMALDRLKYVTKPKNILVVCGLGVCSSRILVYKIRQQYGNYIQDIVTCQFHELRKISLDSFDCILSTVDKPIGTNQPVIYITDFISTLNEEALDQFFLKDEYIGFDVHQYIKEDAFFYVESISSVEEAIDEILNHLPSSYSIPLELKESILKREALSSTSFSNACAIPHPIQMLTEESFCAVLVLNKPMRWGEKWVRFVFLLSPSKYHPEDLRRFNDHLAKLFLNAKKLETFANDPTYLTLKKLLVEG